MCNIEQVSACSLIANLFYCTQSPFNWVLQWAIAYFYKTESDIWAALGQLGSLEFMNFLYFLKTILSSI